MNRRSFLASLLAAPLAAVAALKAKAWLGIDQAGQDETALCTVLRCEPQVIDYVKGRGVRVDRMEFRLAEGEYEPLAVWVDGRKLENFGAWQRQIDWKSVGHAADLCRGTL